MSEVQDYRIKIEAIKQRLKKSNGEGNDEIRELKKRLGTVRDSLQRKQKTIDSQKAEIVTLREESTQLSDLLGQAVAALEGQSRGGIKEIVQSIDSEFAGLLADDDARSEQDGAAGASDTGDTGPGTQEAGSQKTQSQIAPSEEIKWEPENESAPALQRILGRRKR